MEINTVMWHCIRIFLSVQSYFASQEAMQKYEYECHFADVLHLFKWGGKVGQKEVAKESRNWFGSFPVTCHCNLQASIIKGEHETWDPYGDISDTWMRF